MTDRTLLVCSEPPPPPVFRRLVQSTCVDCGALIVVSAETLELLQYVRCPALVCGSCAAALAELEGAA